MAPNVLVVGLGNPGPKYQQNRHNFGFMVLDALAHRCCEPVQWQEKFGGLFVRTQLGQKRAILLKPQTFMNLSGQSVNRAMGFYRILMNDLIVVHDDLDLPFGRILLKKGGSAGGHKGVTSVQQHVGGPDFVRLRLGIGRPTPVRSADVVDKPDVTKYVLGDFSEQEEGGLTHTIDGSVNALECVVRSGLTAAMNKFNKRGGDADGS
ncbi:MAG: aminoacyl-tRNA hydrolase [Myxococcota bacterium]|nr:aminoacyl-tRNA hydrolase [Myxococcota bacterium]